MIGRYDYTYISPQGDVFDSGAGAIAKTSRLSGLDGKEEENEIQDLEEEDEVQFIKVVQPQVVLADVVDLTV